MKQILNYIVSMIIIVFFLLAGTGVNVVHYCCQDCRRAGLEHVIEESCSEVHHHDCACCIHHDHLLTDCSEHEDVEGLKESCEHEADGCWIRHLVVEPGAVVHAHILPSVSTHNILIISTCNVLFSYSATHTKNQYSGHRPYPDKGDGQHVIIRCCQWLI